MSFIKIIANKAGRRFALARDRNAPDKYGVWTECLNYAGHCKGGLARSWRYCELGLSLEDAEALLAKKAAGKRKP